MNTIRIRLIEKADNRFIANVVRRTLEEFGANHPGTVYYDTSTDALFELFQQTSGSIYYIVERDGEVLGGGGIYPSDGLPNQTCELVKMYLLPQARGTGIGRNLLTRCIEFAKEAGYKNIYLETMPELKRALKIYEKFGFEYLDKSMGNTGHHGCELWMMGEVEKLNR